jgi:pyridoxal phosphate enzyme (YggS family)
MSQIKDNLELIRDRINKAAGRAGRDPDGVRLIAVSKKKSVELISEAYSCGQTLFGENYFQEAAEKIVQLDPRINWHFIGHLQSNKAAMTANIFDMIETVDRVKIARILDHSLAELNRGAMPILIQVNIGREANKSGIMPEDTAGLLLDLQGLENIRVQGLMVIPPFSAEPEMVRPYFRQTRELALSLVDQGLLATAGRLELSMGMSGDYEAAVEEGATLIRVGTALFGERS